MSVIEVGQERNLLAAMSPNLALEKERKSFELDPTKPNTANGVGVEHYYYNGSGKDIKYLTFTYVPYNNVGDVVACTVNGKSEARLEITGPVEAAPKAKKLSVSVKALWYNPTITTVKIKSAFIQYMDGTEEMVEGENMLSIYDKESEFYKNIGKINEVTLTKSHFDWLTSEKLIVEKGEHGNDTIIVKKHIKFIGREAFMSKGKYLKFEEGSCLELVFPDGFKGSYFAIVELPKTVKKIGRGAFTDCTWLKKVVIPVNCEVEEGAFDPKIKIERADLEPSQIGLNKEPEETGCVGCLSNLKKMLKLG